MFLGKSKEWWLVRSSILGFSLFILGVLIAASSLDKKDAIDFDCTL